MKSGQDWRDPGGNGSHRFSIDRIVATIGTIREVTEAIAGAVEEQGAATQEIAANTQRAASGAQQVSGTMGASAMPPNARVPKPIS